MVKKIKTKFKPPFMEWGIITKENFNGKTTYDIPIKRWDPLSTIEITTKDFGARNRHSRYHGHYAYLSPIRGKRPKGFKTPEKKSQLLDCSEIILSKTKDIFTSITEGEPIFDDDGNQIGDGYTIIICEDTKRRDNPFSDEPHKIEKISENTKAVTLINRYPSMARVVDPIVKNYIRNNLPRHLRLARGINLVTISRDFYPSMCFRLIPKEVLTGILLSMKEAILYCVQKAIQKDYYDIPVTPFFNIGMKVGGSQPRIHGQVYIDLSMDGHGSRLENYLNAFKEMKTCHLCETTHGNTDRIILKTEYWTFYTSGSPVRNYHVRFHPNEHVRRFTKLNINQLSELADNLKKLLQAMDDIDIDKNRNIMMNCCPFHYDTDFHLFGDIIPHEIIGGAEMAEDMRVARKLPNIAAAEIRDAIEKYG